MKITREVVDYVAELAHLALSESERAGMERDLNSILGYIDTLNELDTTGVAPMAQVASRGTEAAGESLRTDERRPSLDHGAAMGNAPETDGTFFKVPKVIER